MRLYALLALGICMTIATGALHAGPIDDGLLRRATFLFRELQNKGYKNIGILKFRVEKGGKPATFDAGPLNDSMALRLEECLVRANSESNPIGITHQASRVAAAVDGKLSYLTPEGRQKLLSLSYPLLWGSEKVQVDAFLTGVVRISPDYRTTRVTIEIFDRQQPELRELVHFTVETDRNVLTDAGESFAVTDPKVVTRGELAGLAKAFESDAPAQAKPDPAKAEPPPVEQPPVQKREEHPGAQLVREPLKSDPAEFKKASFSAVAPVQFEIYYGDNRIEPMVDPLHPGLLMVPAPTTTNQVRFILRNTTDEKIGVVLRVNGVNTLYKEDEDREVKRYAKWILEPKKNYTIAGFYPDANTVERFQISAPDSNQRLEMGTVASQGLIQLDYFQQGSPEAAEPLASRRSISLRKLSDPDLVKDKPASLADLKARMRKMASAPVQTRNLIVAGERQSTELKESSFDNAVHTGSLTIRYFQPKAQKP